MLCLKLGSMVGCSDGMTLGSIVGYKPNKAYGNLHKRHASICL